MLPRKEDQNWSEGTVNASCCINACVHEQMRVRISGILKARIRWIDYGKGVAIFLVIFGHVALGTLESRNYSGSNALILRYILEATYAIHIPVFFALSGYFFKPLQSFDQLLIKTKKRLLSFGIPYVLFSIVMVSLKFVGGSSVRNQDGISGLLNIYWQPIDYLWFLYALFFVEIAVSLLSILVRSKVVTSLILVMLFIVATQLKIEQPVLSYICLWAPFYYLGYVLRRVTIPRWTAFVAFAIYIVHIPVFCTLNPDQEFLFGYWRIVSVLCVIMMFYFFQHHTSVDFRFFEWCGLGSIELYLVHAPVVSVIRILLFRVGISSLVLQVSFQFLIGTLAGLFVIWLCKYWKMLDFVFKPTKYLLK